MAFWQVELEESDRDKFKYLDQSARLKDGNIDWTKLMTYQSLKLSDNAVVSELVKTNAPLIVGEPLEPTSGGSDCGQKYCIKKGDKSELIREINIRLAGFGGNVPTDKFTDRTEKMIKQFQRDYMKVPETGRICGNVLKAIDEFSQKFDINTTLWSQLKCSCSTKGKQATSKLRGIKEINKCDGFGDGTGKSGNSGNDSSQNVKARHLHFEITDAKIAGSGLNNRENPAYYVRLKEADVSKQENNKD